MDVYHHSVPKVTREAALQTLRENIVWEELPQPICGTEWKYIGFRGHKFTRAEIEGKE